MNKKITKTKSSNIFNKRNLFTVGALLICIFFLALFTSFKSNAAINYLAPDKGGLLDVLQTDPDVSGFTGDISIGSGSLCLKDGGLEVCRNTWPPDGITATSMQVIASLPATCTPGQVVLNSTEGKAYGCTAENVWTGFVKGLVKTVSGGSSGGGTPVLPGDAGLTGIDASNDCSSALAVSSLDYISGNFDGTDTIDCYKVPTTSLAKNSNRTVVTFSPNGTAQFNIELGYDIVHFTSVSTTNYDKNSYVVDASNSYIYVRVNRTGNTGYYNLTARSEEPTCKISDVARSGIYLYDSGTLNAYKSYCSSNYYAYWKPGKLNSLQNSYTICSSDSAKQKGWYNDSASILSCSNGGAYNVEQYNCITKSNSNTSRCDNPSNYFWCCNYE